MKRFRTVLEHPDRRRAAATDATAADRVTST
jgi:hypothetical protein